MQQNFEAAYYTLYIATALLYDEMYRDYTAENEKLLLKVLGGLYNILDAGEKALEQDYLSYSLLKTKYEGMRSYEEKL